MNKYAVLVDLTIRYEGDADDLQQRFPEEYSDWLSRQNGEPNEKGWITECFEMNQDLFTEVDRTWDVLVVKGGTD